MENKDKTTRLMLFVDVQNDFMSKDNGLLYVEGAEEIKPKVQELRDKVYADDTIFENVFYTADWHEEDDTELSDEPDYNTTFPPHCMKETWGAQTIDEAQVKEHDTLRTTVFLKDEFSVFEGNKEFEPMLRQMKHVDEIYIAGVTFEICVMELFKGLVRLKDNGFTYNKIFLIEDAIAPIGLTQEEYQAELLELESKYEFTKIIKVDDIR